MLGKIWTLAATATVALVSSSAASEESKCFPDNFLFGSATASYQVEGAVEEGGRTPSIWDDFCRESEDRACANVADDFFHRYASDVDLMVADGHDTFRFSISWSRVMNWDPETERMKPNPDGIKFYHAMVDKLIEKNIEPILTIYHWDLPSELHTELSPPSWINPEIISHYEEYATLIFHEFGQKVKYWSTFNEPIVTSYFGYGSGRMAPGMSGSDTDTYVVTHHILLSHARAVANFRSLKTAGVVRDDARIGIVIPMGGSYPVDSNSQADIDAAERLNAFFIGWWLSPITTGKYPAIMRERVGDRLPEFSVEEEALVKGSYDLFMVNHYTSWLVTDCDSPRSNVKCESLVPGFDKDMGLDWQTQFFEDSVMAAKNRKGDYNCPSWAAHPEGYMQNIKYTHSFDPKADILLTENGYCGNDIIESKTQLWYYQAYLDQVHKAIYEENIPIIGYTAWSLLDNYEWGSFEPRFGLYYVDFPPQVGSHEIYEPKASDLKRLPRPAAKWFANLSKTKCMTQEMLDAPRSEILQGAEYAVSLSATTSDVHSSTFLVAGTAGLVAVVGAVAFAFAMITLKRRQDEYRPLL